MEGLTGLLRSFLKKRMKIGIISFKYPLDGATASGAYMHTYYLAKSLAEIGCEVHIFCSGEKDRIYKQKRGDGKLIIHVLKIGLGWEMEDRIVQKRINIQTFESRALNFLMYENSKRWFDIVHSQSIPSVGFMLKHFSNMRWIHTFHSLDSVRLKQMTGGESRLIPIYGLNDKTVLDADRLIVVSNNFREEVKKNISGIARKTHVIPNGVDLGLFRPKTKSPLGVLFIGRFSKEKGIGLLPEIIERVLSKNKKYKFIIVSSGGFELDELKETFGKLEGLEKKYGERFKWYREPINEKKVAELHKEVSVLIQPSFYETFGMTSLEGMASGLSVVSTKVGGLTELVSGAGILCKPNASAISKNVLRLLENPKLRLKYKKLGIKRAKQYEWHIIAQRTLDLYGEVLKEKPIEKSKLKKEYKKIVK